MEGRDWLKGSLRFDKGTSQGVFAWEEEECPQTPLKRHLLRAWHNCQAAQPLCCAQCHFALGETRMHIASLKDAASFISELNVER